MPSSRCTVENCPKYAKQGGLCIAHGAKRKPCKHPGCPKYVKQAGLCSTHGPARKRCEAQGCPKVAVQGGRCIAHGAKRKRYSVKACTKQVSLSGMPKRNQHQTKSAAAAAADNDDNAVLFCLPVTSNQTPTTTTTKKSKKQSKKRKQAAPPILRQQDRQESLVGEVESLKLVVVWENDDDANDEDTTAMTDSPNRQEASKSLEKELATRPTTTAVKHTTTTTTTITTNIDMDDEGGPPFISSNLVSRFRNFSKKTWKKNDKDAARSSQQCTSHSSSSRTNINNDAVKPLCSCQSIKSAYYESNFYMDDEKLPVVQCKTCRKWVRKSSTTMFTHLYNDPHHERALRRLSLPPQLRFQQYRHQVRFQQLRDFRDKNNHTRVPRGYVENPSLSFWVDRLRHQKKLFDAGKKSWLTKEKIATLDSVGFVWVVKNSPTSFEDRIQQLLEFRDKKNHTRVPSRYAENPSLGQWVADIRQQKKLFDAGKKSRLTKEKIATLDSVGFVWVFWQNTGGQEALSE